MDYISFPTHFELVDHQVIIRFENCEETQALGRKLKELKFVDNDPEEYKGHKVSFALDKESPIYRLMGLIQEINNYVKKGVTDASN